MKINECYVTIEFHECSTEDGERLDQFYLEWIVLSF